MKFVADSEHHYIIFLVYDDGIVKICVSAANLSYVQSIRATNPNSSSLIYIKTLSGDQEFSRMVFLGKRK